MQAFFSESKQKKKERSSERERGEGRGERERKFVLKQRCKWAYLVIYRCGN